jgi:hypothetical protein
MHFFSLRQKVEAQPKKPEITITVSLRGHKFESRRTGVDRMSAAIKFAMSVDLRIEESQ